MPDTVRSADGTTIAYERTGSGPPLVVVGGAFNTRRSASALAPLLASHSTVLTYDRRGRGDSGDTPPYAAEREIEDLGALIAAAGGSAAVYGHSSGAALALEAAAAGLPITRVAAYEPPYTAAADRSDPPDDLGVRIRAAVEAGEPETAAELFFADMGPEMLAGVKRSGHWEGMVAVAHTLPYEFAVLRDGVIPGDRLAGIAVPTLLLDGGDSDDWARHAMTEVAQAIPGAVRITVEGQGHGVADEVIAPLLVDFFKG